MPLSIFLIVNNNTKSCLIAQSLVFDEMVETYKWILEYTKHATITEPMVFITDDSGAEQNALEFCWSQGICLICTFHVLQAFWRWIYNSKHKIKKEDKVSIMEKMKKILYAQSESEMNSNYNEFKQIFYK